MQLGRLGLTGVAATLLLLLPEVADAGRNVEIYPLSKVRRGQTGHGLTTMKGTTPERFEFEVIGVAKNFLPRMDIILVKSDDKKLAVTGFWQGMSGSPLFIDGKLVCAFSYGFRFNKVAIGGCTPIDYMKREGFKPLRQAEIGRPTRRAARQILTPTSVASLADWQKVAPGGRVASAGIGEARRPWLLSTPLPPAPARPASSAGGRDAPAVPLSMAGFSAPAFERAREVMASYPLEPMQAGGTGSPDDGPSAFTLGSSIAVQLIRGDMSAAATGTVSFVEGDGVLAFGHPMFQSGEMFAPVAAAEVHTVIPSAQSAFVMASPLRELGALVQDRQSCISADTGKKVRMVPVDLYIQASDGKTTEKGEFHVEVLNDKFFTGGLAGIVAGNAASLYLPDRDHVTARLESKVWVRGHEPLAFTDYLYSATGGGGVVDGARGLRALVPLLMNPFQPVEIERVEVRVDLSYDTNYGDIERLRLPVAELTPGKKTYVEVELSRFDGKRVVDRVPFFVPDDLAGSIVNLEVTAGDAASLDAAPPESFDDLMAALRKLLPGDVYAVTLYTANEGAAVSGRIVRDLPSSALDRLHTGAATTGVKSYKAIARSTSKASRVVNGKKTILVKVADKK
jgi:hypothetical protein